MPTVTYTQQEYLALALVAEELRTKLEASESMRPQWAKGYTDDSMAAQSKAVALQQIWNHLGVTHQTDCMMKLKSITSLLEQWKSSFEDHLEGGDNDIVTLTKKALKGVQLP